MKRIPCFSLAVSLCLGASLPARAAQRQVLRGHLPAAVAKLAPVGRLPGSTNLNLAIGLPLRNREALTNLLRQLYDPASPEYRQYLTPEQFTARFGPAEEDYQALARFARSHRLRVAGTHPNRMLLDVSGSAADIELAFHVTLRVYQHPTEARTFFAPDTEPSLDLAVPVLHISGLDNFTRPHPNVKVNPLPKPANATPAAGTGPVGTYIGYDFRTAYVPDVALTGSGQRVGLLEFDGYFPQDVAAYKSLAGLPDVPVTSVLLNGFDGSPGGGNIEVALDIDMAISMAPGMSELIVYEGANPDDMLNRMATDNRAKQLSSSWSWSPFDATATQIFQQFGAQGQSMFEASGDTDAYAGPVDPPSDNPYLTIVGGTTLTMTPNAGARVSETVWNWGNGYGSGGGISTTYLIPSWQQGIDMTTNQGSTTLRNLPDVAMVADNVFLYAFDGTPESVGGTSCSAPLWAGFTALVNQLATDNDEPPVGFINPAVYAIGKGGGYGSSFHDITTGNNESSSSPARFAATAGYDLCTGWGTPIGSNLLYALGVPEPLRITPRTGLVFSGPVGGPFNPAVQTYSLTNHGSAALNWTLVNTSPWLSAFPVGGTLSPGGPAATVAVGLTPAASNLVAGSYSATVWFTNLDDHYAQSRTFALAVVTPPVITTQPASQAVLEGVDVTFTVGTTSNALLSYQWQEDNGSFLTNLTDDGNRSGSATATLTIRNVSAADVGAYSVIVSNVAGVAASDDAFLTIVPWRPVIVTQPTNQTVLPGAAATFSVATVGTHPFFYQWQQNGTNLTDGGYLSGAATRTLTVSNVTPGSVGTYSVIVTNSRGSVTSAGAVLAVVSVTAPGVSLATLSSFAGGDSGLYPFSPLVQGPDGNFYGTTIEGGSSGYGTVFRADTNGTMTTLASFNIRNGAVPYAGLALGQDGNFYGTTSQGGAYGAGTAFRITTNGTLTTLASFNGDNGYFSVAGLVQGADGNFYGTTLYGGTYGLGNVFKMATNGALANLVSFDDTDGAYPSCALIPGLDGNFYGTTENGGTNGGWGTVFRMTPSGALNTLVSFDHIQGGIPVPGLVQDTDGNFYGTTYYGGKSDNGMVFRMTPDGTLTILYSFTGDNDGGNPWGGLALGADGNLYGTTQNGGAYADGTVFRMGPNGSLATLAAFDGYQGANPVAAMVQGTDGDWYGTTPNGGANGFGVIFRLGVGGLLQITSQPANQEAFVGTTASFNVATFGSLPVFYHWQRHGTNLTDGGNLSGSTTRTLTFTNVTTANASSYSVMVSNAFGSLTSAAAALEVIVSPPFITSAPVDQTVLEGTTVTFTVAALGDLPIFYQWQKNGSDLTDDGNVQGSATSTLTLSGATEADSGTYSVIVSNDIDWVASPDAALTVVPLIAPGSTLATLRSFTNGSGGSNPNGLALGRNGSLYGTTENGGLSGNGTVFKMTPDTGALTPLVSFKGTDGANPNAGLVQANDGNFYGTTANGGAYFSGSIFRAGPDNGFASIYSFTGGDDGANPVATLVQGNDGNLYGTAYVRGTYGYGTVFKATTNGVVTNLYAFTGGYDGANPWADLMLGADGNLYGATAFGGTNDSGTVFRITPGGAINTLYSFTGGDDGAYPVGRLAQGKDGIFYGTTYGGGSNGVGTVFSLTAGGALTTLYAFSGTDGANPQAALVQGSDGDFYGATGSGGLGGDGTVFKITTNGLLTTLVWFEGANGANPIAALVQVTRADFYGTTYNGGPGGGGTVFRFTIPVGPQITVQPSNQLAAVGASVVCSVEASGTALLTYQWQLNGTNLADGGNLSGSTTPALTFTGVTPANGGSYSVIVSNAYGSVASSNAVLTVFPATVPGVSLATLYSFSGGNDGANPNGLIQGTNGIFYGTTQNGGTNASGTVFQMTADATLTGLHSFTGDGDGASPRSALAQGADGNFYGTTIEGGSSGYGTAFSMTTDGLLATLAAFDYDHGANPYAGLLQGTDGVFYGTTYAGGDSGVGTVFSLTNTGGPVTLAAFDDDDGGNPYAGLVQGADGNFYGTTEYGGTNGVGTVFEMTPSGALTTLYSFAGPDGAQPYAGLVQGGDGNFYGTTFLGGPNDRGTAFRITADGKLTPLVSFNGTNGANPHGALVQGGDGSFYGTTETGGLGGAGTAFKMTPDGILTTLAMFAGFNGANPQAALAHGTDGWFYGTTRNGGASGHGTIFRLSVPTAPVLQSVAQTDGTLQIAWRTVAGRRYQLQYCTDLIHPDWIGLGSIITATNGTLTTPDVIGPDPQRFYRLVLFPQD